MKFATESERDVAALVAQNGDALRDLHELGLKAEDFAMDDAFYVVAAAEQLMNRNEAVTPQTVRHVLREEGWFEECGGQAWWNNLLARTEDAESVPTLGKTIAAASMLRDVDEPASEILEAINGDVTPRTAIDIVHDTMPALLRAQASHDRKVLRGDDLAAGFMDLITGEDHKNSLQTGFPGLDKQIDGLHVGRVNVIAARSDHGKSVYTDQIMLNVARRWADDGKRVVKFDIENGERGAYLRLAANLSGVPIGEIKRHDSGRSTLSDAKQKAVIEAADQIQSLPLTVDTSTGVDTTYIRSRVLSEQARGDVGLIIVDYLTQMSEPGDGTMEKLMNAMSGLHRLAKDMSVPVIAVSQINRKPFGRSSAAPQLQDMSWSDDVAQVPAQVQCLHNPYSHWEQTERKPSEMPDENLLEVYVRKNKGKKGQYDLHFEKNYLRITDDYDRAPANPTYQGDGAPAADESPF